MIDRFDSMTRDQLAAELRRLYATVPEGHDPFALAKEIDTLVEERRLYTEQLAETQHALEVSRDRFAELYDSVPIGYATLNPLGVILEFNLTAAAMLGPKRSPPTNAPLLAYIHPDDRPAFYIHLRRCRTEPGPVGTDLRLAPPRRDEPPTPVYLFSRSAPSPDGNGLCLLTALIDMTELRRAQASARLNEDRLRLALRAAQAGTWEWDVATGECVWSDEYYRLHGLEPGSVTPSYQAWLERIHPDDLRRADAELQHILDHRVGEFHLEFRVRNRRPQGDGARWLATIGRAAYNEHGRALRLAGITFDITDRKRAEEELALHRNNLEDLVTARTRELKESHERLRLAERMASLGTLSAGLGHDMGNLLLPIRMRLDSLAEAPLPAEAKEDIAAVRQAAEYLQRLTSGLRLFTLDPTAPGNHDEQSELTEWALDAYPFLKHTLSAGIHFELAIPPGLPPVRIARHRLAQAVFNLVQNAGEIMAPRASGRVRMTAELAPPAQSTEPPAVRLSIADDGPGMTPEVRARCLEPFFTTKTRAHSTGLGLALVHAIIQGVGGSIEIDTQPGRGTTFTLILPTVKPEDPHTDAPKPAVAYVDLKDARLTSYVRSILRTHDFTVEHAGNSPMPEHTSLLVADGSRTAAAKTFVHAAAERRAILLGREDPQLFDPRIIHLPQPFEPSALRNAVESAAAAITSSPNSQDRQHELSTHQAHGR